MNILQTALEALVAESAGASPLKALDGKTLAQAIIKDAEGVLTVSVRCQYAAKKRERKPK